MPNFGGKKVDILEKTVSYDPILLIKSQKETYLGAFRVHRIHHSLHGFQLVSFMANTSCVFLALCENHGASFTAMYRGPALKMQFWINTTHNQVNAGDHPTAKNDVSYSLTLKRAVVHE